MPLELLVVGTSGQAKETAQLARLVDPQGERWHRISYVAEAPDAVGTALPFGEIRYTDDDLAQPRETADVVVGIGHPRLRERVARRLGGLVWLQFPNLIHPGVEIDPALVRLGRGNIFTKGVVLTCDIVMGDFNLLNWNVTVGHDARIGSYNVINPGSNLSGSVHVGDACLLGTGCQVLERLAIASGATVGAGAVVTKSIAKEGVYVGVPARMRR